MRRRAKPFTCFWLSYIVFGSSALEQFSENVVSFGLTFRWMTKDCHPSQGAGGGGGGGEGGERWQSWMTSYILTEGFSGTNFKLLERTNTSASKSGRSGERLRPGWRNFVSEMFKHSDLRVVMTDGNIRGIVDSIGGDGIRENVRMLGMVWGFRSMVTSFRWLRGQYSRRGLR